jgi:hypothetical protein
MDADLAHGLDLDGTLQPRPVVAPLRPEQWKERRSYADRHL